MEESRLAVKPDFKYTSIVGELFIDIPQTQTAHVMCDFSFTKACWHFTENDPRSINISTQNPFEE